MGYTEIVEIANEVLDYIEDNYNLTYSDLVKVVDKLGDIVSFIGKYGCPVDDDDLIE